MRNIFRMNRRLANGIILSSVALAAGLAAYLALGRRPVPLPAPPLSSPAGPAVREITVRNAMSLAVSFTLRTSGSTGPRKGGLEPGALERHSSELPLLLTYQRGGVEVTHVLIPGNPYVFRPDEEGLPRIYGGSHMRADAEDLAPFVPTPMIVVDKMLEVAAAGPRDVVYDIGCGDGRIVIRAALKKRARGVGIDIDPERIGEAEKAAREAGVRGRIRFITGDALKTDLSEATVVTLYLLPESNERMRPKLERELRPGAAVISHNYRMPGWEGKLFASAEVRDEQGKIHSVYGYRR